MKLMQTGFAAAALLALGAFAAPDAAKAGSGVSIRVPGFSLYVDDDDHRHRHRRHYGYYSRCDSVSRECAYRHGYRDRGYYRCMRRNDCR